MKAYYALIDDGGIIASPFDTEEDTVKEFGKLCDEGFSFKSNINVALILKPLK